MRYRVTKPLTGLIPLIWKAWKRVDNPKGWVEYYSFFELRDVIVRDEGIAKIISFFFKSGWGDEDRNTALFNEGDSVDISQITPWLKKDYEHTQSGSSNLRKGVMLVLTRSGYFERIKG